MLKVIIADDEKMICLLISQLLDWKELDFEIAGMAYTGIDAYQMIVEHRPDLVITDIRMPGYDGIELIKKVKEAGIQTEFIMISGFKQFEYAQNAMKYGVKYYLLKPIEEDKLLEIVQEIRQDIYDRIKHRMYESNLETEVKETRDKMKKRFLTSILPRKNGRDSDVGIDREMVNDEYKTQFQDGVFQAIVVKLDTEYQPEDGNQLVIDEIEKRVADLEAICEEQISVNMHSGTIALLNYRIEQKEAVYGQLREMYAGIREYISQFQGFTVVLGIGEKRSQFFDAQICLKTAIDAVKYRIRFYDAGIIFYEHYQFDPYDISRIITTDKIQNFEKAIETENIRAAIACIVSDVREIRYGEQNYAPILLYDIMQRYVEILTAYCKRYQLYNDEYVEGLGRWNEAVDNARTERAIMEETEKFIRSILESIFQKRKEIDIKPIRVIKEYIEAHYMQEINLNQLAEMVDMNASYLSSVFKKETGMTYSDYLTRCRMECARDLLVHSNKSILEIAKDSGYQNTRYFSKQFQKQIGLKPSEYRRLYS
ncbi:response regulator [Mordavella massiliensis]|uniref:response regulator transcription factor n=1 Tax=Mordavella massiliensis TaxID=1871024 RepID=UPI00210C5C2C|nr:response regulator [Mordavella massiliensis]